MAGAAELFQSWRGIFKAYCSSVRNWRCQKGLMGKGRREREFWEPLHRAAPLGLFCISDFIDLFIHAWMDGFGHLFIKQLLNANSRSILLTMARFIF